MKNSQNTELKQQVKKELVQEMVYLERSSLDLLYIKARELQLEKKLIEGQPIRKKADLIEAAVVWTKTSNEGREAYKKVKMTAMTHGLVLAKKRLVEEYLRFNPQKRPLDGRPPEKKELKILMGTIITGALLKYLK
jgi:hypothetical protein